MRVAICAVVKDEQDIVGEWIAYHLSVGFDTLLLFDNGSTDKTAEIITKAALVGDVRLVKWPATTSDFQTRCYSIGLSMLQHEAEWVLFIDIDEFFVPERDGDVHGFLATIGSSPAAIAVPELFFGSSNRLRKADDLVTRSYVARADLDFGANLNVKSFVATARSARPGNPHFFHVEGDYVGVDAKPVEWLREGVAARVQRQDIAHINHYFTRSREDWDNKMSRGHPDGTVRGDDAFETYDRNEVFDDLALRPVAQVEGLLARMGRQNGRGVCLCIIFNHPPMPGHIELIREIYSGRFPLLRFIVPMERIGDDDVITVYRGSYTHNAYITDALHELLPVACSHYLLTHDDVLLSPRLNSTNLLPTLGVEGDEGFIPFIAPTPANIGDWGHWSGSLWRLLHPRNHLSGTGVQNLETILNQLAPLDEAVSKLGVFGAPPSTTFELTPDSLNRSGALRRFCNFGYPDEAMNAAFMHSYLNGLFHAPDGEGVIDLPYPFVYAGFGGDFVLVPKAHARDFAHYSGVLAAAGVFAEIAHPTALALACTTVRTAEQPLPGFDWSVSLLDALEVLERMEADPTLLAAHPVKLSTVRDHAALLRCFSSDRRSHLPAPERFNAALYLAANPDVAACGMDAWHHYIHHGRNEHRPLRPLG